MKYIKPTDFLSVRQLQAEYKRIEGEITDLLLTDASARTAAELNDKLQQALNAATRYLAKVNDEFAKKELSTAFKEGKDSVHESAKVSAKEADAILSAQGFRYSEKAFAKHTYIELQTATENAGKGLKTRVNGIIEGLRKTGNDSVYNVQQAILKDIQDKGLMYVEYANGAKQTLDAYAAMAARSARIESTNIGAVGRALQAGTDLVRMTTMPQCCKLCGAYQDKVYSISGKDKRFPALFKTVLKNGYALPHPNCRHEFIPYFAEAEDPSDVERMIKQSRIKYDSKGRLADVRTQSGIELYQSWQAGNRQRNTELLEYNKMRAYYEAKKIDAPYATLGAFRRARRAQSENYRESRKEWAKEPKASAQSTQAVQPLQDEIDLQNYQVPKAPVVRREKDAEQWARYDSDYHLYESEEPSITKDVDKISAEVGLPLIGREHRLKGKQSYDRKVNDKRLGKDYKQIGNAVRYTFEHKSQNAVKDIQKTLAKFEENGYTIISVDNKWKANGVYKGVNVDILSPKGVPIEVQFLTKRNHALKDVMHKYYEIARASTTPERIKALAEKKMQELATLWEYPEGIKEL